VEVGSGRAGMKLLYGLSRFDTSFSNPPLPSAKANGKFVLSVIHKGAEAQMM
jgi:hypothetical protein